MSSKSKIYWRIKALLFAGAISAASLRGCTYGPPPVDFKNNQEVAVQNSNSSMSSTVQEPSFYDNYNNKYNLEEKSGPTKKL